MIPWKVLHPLHRAGLGLVAVLAVWIMICGAVWGRSPWTLLLVVGICVVGYAVGRLSARKLAFWAVPAAIVVFALFEVYRSPAESFSFLSAQGLLGYSNAKAAFFVQAAFASVFVLARNRSWKVGVVLLPVVILFLVIPIATRSLGAFLSSLVVLPAVFVAVFRRGHRPLMIAAMGMVACSLFLILFLSSKFSNGFSPGREVEVAERLDYGRSGSWGVAYKMIAEHPVFGVGPGGFRDASPFSRRISDLSWAHNEFLQIGAELGIVGLFLVLGLFAWTFMRLSSPLAGSSTVAALAVGALAMHASVDYLFHFPALPAVTLALVGSAPLRGPRSAAPKRRTARA